MPPSPYAAADIVADTDYITKLKNNLGLEPLAFEQLLPSSSKCAPTLKELVSRIQASGLFDADAYLANYPDVAKSPINPVEHYLLYGIHENRTFFMKEDSKALFHDKTDKQYVIFDFGSSLDTILTIFPALTGYIAFIVSDRKEVGGIETIKKEALPTLAKGHHYNFVLGNEQKLIEDRQFLRYETGSKSHEILIIQDFLLDMLEDKNVVFMPTAIRLEASTICNLNCPACYMRRENNGTMGVGYLKPGDFRRLIEENHFIQTIELSNSGEVFMNPELLEIVRIAAELGVSLTMNNGVNLNKADPEVLEEMVKSGAVKSMTVSIDGATQGVYATYRKKGMLQHVFENIKRINDLKKIHKKKTPRLDWQYILFPHNEHEAEAAKMLAFCLDMKLHFKLDWGAGLKPKDPEKLEKITGIRFFTRAAHAKNFGSEYLGNTMCRQLIFSPQINYDGRLLGCCGVYKSDWGVNVFEDGLLNSVNSQTYKDAMRLVLGGGSRVASGSPCSLCHLYPKYVAGNRLIL